MADFDSKVTISRELQANLSNLKKIMPQFVKDAINTHALAIQAQAKRNITDAPAVDTGQLRASVKIETYSSGYAARVGTDVAHGKWIEFGTGPHFPPLEPIREWARRHGLPPEAAYPIALAISKRGTPARAWLHPAFEAERPNFDSVIREAWHKVLSELQ
jgi:hypothetical protein